MPVGNFHLCALPHQVVLDEAKHLANLRASVGVKDVRPRPDIPLAPVQDEGKVSRIKAVYKWSGEGHKSSLKFELVNIRDLGTGGRDECSRSALRRSLSSLSSRSSLSQSIIRLTIS